jgi:hypothetical protein
MLGIRVGHRWFHRHPFHSVLLLAGYMISRARGFEMGRAVFSLLLIPYV